MLGMEQETRPTTNSEQKLPRWADWIGWYGTVAIVGAYMGLSWGWLDQGVIYQTLNLTGALGVGLVCYLKQTWQPFWLQAVWVLISIVALVELFRHTA